LHIAQKSMHSLLDTRHFGYYVKLEQGFVSKGYVCTIACDLWPCGGWLKIVSGMSALESTRSFGIYEVGFCDLL
jgi:hypothetical protein